MLTLILTDQDHCIYHVYVDISSLESLLRKNWATNSRIELHDGDLRCTAIMNENWKSNTSI